MGRTTRNFATFLLWSALHCVAVFITLAVAMANYQGCAVAFDLLGWEAMPLADDAFLGPYVGAFLGESTLSRFYALCIAATLALGLFIVLHLLFRAFQLWGDRNQYRLQDDHASADFVTRRLIRNLAIAGLFAVAIFYAAVWDVALFRYRSIAGAEGLDLAKHAAASILSWPAELEKNGGKFAWNLADIGALGYLAITALSCLSVEVSMLKMGESFSQFTESAGQVLGMTEGEYADEGDDYDERQASDHDFDERDEEFSLQNLPDLPAEPQQEAEQRSQPVHDLSLPEAPQVDAASEGELPDCEAPVSKPVIGAPETSLTIEEARAEPGRYYIDEETTDIWDLALWQSVHGDLEQASSAA